MSIEVCVCRRTLSMSVADTYTLCRKEAGSATAAAFSCFWTADAASSSTARVNGEHWGVTSSSASSST